MHESKIATNFIGQHIADFQIISFRVRPASCPFIISGIEIALALDRPGVISTITIREGEGGTTVFQFSDVQINAALSESVFRRP